MTGALQYGFHISALNSAQDSLTCSPGQSPSKGLSGLPTCVEITTNQFGVITAAFTLGGLVSSFQSGRLADGVGRKLAAVYSSVLIVAGGVSMSMASSMWVLVLGRFLVGLACGISTVLVPLFLSEVAPVGIKGSVGVLTQLSICIGIFLGQLVSIPLSRQETGLWRVVPLVSASIALVQIFTAPGMIESPTYLAEQKPRMFPASEEERAPLATGEDEDDIASDAIRSQSRERRQDTSLTLFEALKSQDPAVRKGLEIVVLAQAFQQGSGINAVMYYSTGILSTISPKNAKYVSLFVTLVNVIMTLPTVYLIDRAGRRFLLLSSLTMMSISSVILGYSINTFQFALAAVFIVLFVATFSIGLGPIPFLLLGEVPPPQARPASASAALGMNWGLNLFVGLGFLPLRDWLSGGDPSGEGTVFYLFAVISLCGTVTLWRLLSN